MKKFLKLEHSLCSKKVPDELDIPVLAAAAMRAKSFRRRRTMLKVVLPGTVSTIAAAAALLIMMPSMTITPVPGKAVSGTSVNTAKLKIQTNPETIVEQNVSQYDMLALADTSALEQECYNLSTMAEFSFDSENFII
ncbi:MAG: hypothetical protein E7043_08640 [Lentisphaerae bacterium]|nr:hypothetical protein [Lentisphaerota bacterium]